MITAIDLTGLLAGVLVAGLAGGVCLNLFEERLCERLGGPAATLVQMMLLFALAFASMRSISSSALFICAVSLFFLGYIVSVLLVTEFGGGGGGGRDDSDRDPPDGPGEPDWWPEFEEQLRSYGAGRRPRQPVAH